jgi:hypothetical protein
MINLTPTMWPYMSVRPCCAVQHCAVTDYPAVRTQRTVYNKRYKCQHRTIACTKKYCHFCVRGIEVISQDTGHHIPHPVRLSDDTKEFFFRLVESLDPRSQL